MIYQLKYQNGLKEADSNPFGQIVLRPRTKSIGCYDPTIDISFTMLR